MKPTSFTNVTILIAEDDDGHAELIMEHLHEAGLCNEMQRFNDGQALLQYLASAKHEWDPTDERRFLLLLDLSMPRQDGLDVLRHIKADQHWQNMPIIVLTTTDDPREIESCYELGCNCYITKPIEYERFKEMLRRLGLFLMVVAMPKIGSQKEGGGTKT